MAIIAQIKLECIKENKYYDDETDLLSSILHAKKNARNAPSMLSFCKLAGHINREKKNTGNFYWEFQPELKIYSCIKSHKQF